MNNNYYEEENFKKTQKILEIRKKLPIHSNQFFIGIETRTTPQTRLNYARDLLDFYNYLSKNIFLKDIKDITIENLNQLTSTDIEMFLDYLTLFEKDGKKITNSTKSKTRKLSTIRSYLKYFFNKNQLFSNVASKVPLPKLHEKPIIKLDNYEIEKILDKTENLDIPNMTKKQKNYNKEIAIRDIAILYLFLGTGIRVSELVGINIDDFDFEKKAFKITRKGGNSTIIYCSNEVIDSIEFYLKIREKVFKPKNKDENALFLSIQGKRITVRSVQLLVKKYTESIVPLKHITPHKLRSTFGTNLYQNTRDIFIVAEVLGHKDVNTTKRFYATISDDIKKEAADKISLRKK